jgi:hypothetical protein
MFFVSLRPMCFFLPCAPPVSPRSAKVLFFFFLFRPFTKRPHHSLPPEMGGNNYFGARIRSARRTGIAGTSDSIIPTGPWLTLEIAIKRMSSLVSPAPPPKISGMGSLKLSIKFYKSEAPVPPNSKHTLDCSQ